MDADGPLLTLPEIASRIGISETTARNWARAYGDLVISRIGPDGYRRYALRRYERIAELRRQRLPSATIRAALGAEPEEVEPVVGVAERQLAALERIAEAVERIADRLEQHEER